MVIIYFMKVYRRSFHWHVLHQDSGAIPEGKLLRCFPSAISTQLQLIVNDEQCLRAVIGSLSKRCQYCSKALGAYPLILSDDARLAVYHAGCAAALATEILVDLYTFLNPPAPYQQLFVLIAPDAAAPLQAAMEEM